MITISKEYNQNMLEDLVRDIRQVAKEEIERIREAFNPSNDENIFYNLEQVAEMLGISSKTMYSLNSKKEIAYSKQAGKCFYTKKDILEFINRGKVKSKYEIEFDAQQSLLNLKSRNYAR